MYSAKVEQVGVVVAAPDQRVVLRQRQFALDRRVEVVTPVEDHEAQARLARIIEVMLADDRRSWRLSPDGRWQRVEVLESREGTVETFAVLKDDAATASALADVPRRPHAQAGSMDPRA